MHANLDVYYQAEQANRQRLAGRAARGWLAEEAAASRPASNRGTQVRRATGALLVRAGARLQGIALPGPVPPVAAPGGAPARG